jgi:23S rRNA (pseudouridine1915-N3)-methyltransferase
MLEINVVAVGKVKEKSMRELVAEYSKRITAFAKLNIVEIKEINTDDQDKNLANEALAILEKLKGYVVTLEIEGVALESRQLATFIQERMNQGVSTINFVIGSSCGLSQIIKDKANYRLSLSRLTFPHQLTRVILLEQIYRSFTIINNQSYHK